TNDDPIQCLEAEPRGLFFLSDDASVLSALLRAGVSEADVRFLLVRPGDTPKLPGVAAVADPDIVMANPADWNLHLLQVAIRLGQKTSAVSEAEPPERSRPDPEALDRMYREVPEALVESLRVAEAC